MSRDRRAIGPALRWLVSLAVLVAIVFWLEPGSIAGELGQLEPAWVALALGVSLAQMLLSAWRWRFTARRLGLELGQARALADYYLATFVNQVLPGGVIGDAWRAQRHARSSGQTGPAWRAVIIERTSGQTVVIALSVLVLLLWPGGRAALSSLWSDQLALVLFLLGLLVIGLCLLARRFARPLRLLAADLRIALLARDAWPLQLTASVLIVFSYALVFALAARAIGVDLALTSLLSMALPVLLAMLIPFSVGGLGFREAAAAVLWVSLGMSAEQGVAVALTYAVVVFCAALPGAVVLLFRPADAKHPA